MKFLRSNKTKNTVAARLHKKGRLKSFAESDSGAAAVEFTMVAIPFLVLIFSIFEQGMQILGHKVLDAGVNSIARQIKTGQITAANTTESEFKTALCNDPLMFMFDCDRLSVDVQVLASFESPDAAPTNDDGSLDTTDFGFSPGGRQTINIMRAYYDWPTFLDWKAFAQMRALPDDNAWGKSTSSRFTSAGNLRIVGMAAFVTEPF